MGEFVIDEDEARDLLGGDQSSIKSVGVLIKRTLDSEEFKPPLLPEVALSLTELSGKPNVSIREVEEVVQRDPVVAARVVAVANSAFFNRGVTIKSLRNAITRLGMSEVRDIAFQVVAQTRIFRVKPYLAPMRSLFETSQAAGLLAKKTCRLLRFESELAYLCGLFHDMGLAIILGIIAERARKQKHKPPEIEAIEDALDAFHAQAGARVCTMWGMPDLITDAIWHHHKPERSSNPSQMATVVAIADVLLRHAGIGCDASPIEPLQERLFYKVNLTPEQVKELLLFSEDVAERLGEYCVG